MKILLVSDSHNDLEYLYDVIKNENPDLTIFAGDHSSDAIDMQNIFFDKKFIIVRGNCDYFDRVTKDIEEVEIENLGKIVLTHGHLHGVKSNLNNIYSFGVEKGANMVVFGHTHIQHKSEFKGILFINPGAIVNHQYAIIENEKIIFKGGKNYEK